MKEIGPKTRQRIIDEVHRSGEHEATHYGVQVHIVLHQINGKAHVGMAVCNRVWKNYTIENVFAAVELLNAILAEKAQRKQQVQDQLPLGGESIQLG